MTTNIVRIDGYPLAPGLARDWLRMVAAAANDGVRLVVNSGYRTKSEQTKTFTDRYTRGATSTTRPPDYRRFDGSWWGRTSGEGVVASPDEGSNHTRGYAVDIYMGPGVYAWLVRNAHRFNFNHIEGARVGESWHWCWHVGIYPTATSPDPWEGRGAPDPVHSSDQGIAVEELGNYQTGSGGSSTVETDEEWLMAASDDVAWIKDRLGGSVKSGTVTDEIRQLQADVAWLKDQVGGSSSRKTSLRQDVDKLLKG